MRGIYCGICTVYRKVGQGRPRVQQSQPETGTGHTTLGLAPVVAYANSHGPFFHVPPFRGPTIYHIDSTLTPAMATQTFHAGSSVRKQPLNRVTLHTAYLLWRDHKMLYSQGERRMRRVDVVTRVLDATLG